MEIEPSYHSAEEAYVTATAVSVTFYSLSLRNRLRIGETYFQKAQRRAIKVHPE